MPRPVLTENHYDTLCKLIGACEETQAYLNKCKACELDVSQQIADNEEQIRVAQKIKANFFPDRP